MSFLDFLFSKKILTLDVYDKLKQNTNDIDFHIFSHIEKNKYIDEKFFKELKAQYFCVDPVDLCDFNIVKFDVDYHDSFIKFQVIPFCLDNQTLHIALNDLQNIEALDFVNKIFATTNDFKDIRKKFYVTTAKDITNIIVRSKNETILENIFRNPKLIEASDIHITPYLSEFFIKLRIDGELRTLKTYPIEFFDSILVSIKVLSGIDISETRNPQTGNFEKNFIDFRVSTHPTRFGENIVIRILRRDKKAISIENLGLSKNDIIYLKSICEKKNGLIIFCGPTGSGKTTSICSLLNFMDKETRNIMTLEDPIEYQIPGVKQTEIKKGGINFSEGIRSILRQDPDVILIGEIRDEQSAQMAIRASLTGHLVFTTLHANNCFGIFNRFEEFGISKDLLIDNLLIVVAQRLFKKAQTNGRTLVYETLKFNEKIKKLLTQDLSSYELRQLCEQKFGLKSIEQDYEIKRQGGIIIGEF